MAIVYANDGRAYPLSRLKCINPGDGVDLLILSDGDVGELTLRVASSDLRLAMDRWIQRTFPPQPGSYVLSIVVGDNLVDKRDLVWREELLAWGITMDGLVLPITLDGPLSGDHVIVFADGHVECPGDRRFDTVDEYLDALLSARRREANARTATLRCVDGDSSNGVSAASA